MGADDAALVRRHAPWRGHRVAMDSRHFRIAGLRARRMGLIKAAASELANRLPGMMTLIALGISVAFIFSLAVTFGFPGADLWMELATLVTVMVLGHLPPSSTSRP
jgi:cation transport ATPase